MTTKQMVLVVAPPGDLQIGLQALLAVLPGVEVLVAAEGSLALEVIDKHAPSLVILDDGLPGQAVPFTAGQIKIRCPDVRCLVLVDDGERRQRVQQTSADLVLIKGYPPARLIAAIEELLS